MKLYLVCGLVPGMGNVNRSIPAQIEAEAKQIFCEEFGLRVDQVLFVVSEFGK